MKKRLYKIAFLSTLFLSVGYLESLSIEAEAEEIVKKSIEEEINEIQSSPFSDIEKVTSLLDLYDKQQEQQHAIQSKISEIKIHIEDKENNYKDLESKVKNNNTEVEKINVNIKDKEKEIKQKQQELENKQKELEKINKDIDSRKEQLAKILRNAQTNKSKSSPNIIDLVLNAESVSDVITRVNSMNQITNASNIAMEEAEKLYKQQTEVKKSIEDLKSKIEKEKQGLEEQKALTEADTNKQKEKQKEVKAEKSNLEEQIKESEKAIKQAEENQKEVKKEFKKLTDKLINYQEEIKKMINETQDEKHKEILIDLNKRIDAIKPVITTNSSSSASVGQTWTFDTANLDKARQKLVDTAITQLGVPYVWGGTAWNSGLDCSGLTMNVYQRALGINILRVTTQQQNMGKEVALKDIKTGDLIFWGPADATTHVAMYIGDGVYIHAPQPGDVVQYSRYNLESACHIRRIIE